MSYDKDQMLEYRDNLLYNYPQYHSFISSVYWKIKNLLEGLDEKFPQDTLKRDIARTTQIFSTTNDSLLCIYTGFYFLDKTSVKVPSSKKNWPKDVLLDMVTRGMVSELLRVMFSCEDYTEFNFLFVRFAQIISGFSPLEDFDDSYDFHVELGRYGGYYVDPKYKFSIKDICNLADYIHNKYTLKVKLI